jgi:hypothetical protein
VGCLTSHSLLDGEGSRHPYPQSITDRYRRWRWPCEFEVDQAKNPLLDRVHDFIQHRAGGTLRYDTIILTGGGCGLLERDLRGVLSHGNIHLAAQADEIHLANVYGGRKMFLLMQETGAI